MIRAVAKSKLEWSLQADGNVLLSQGSPLHFGVGAWVDNEAVFVVVGMKAFWAQPLVPTALHNLAPALATLFVSIYQEFASACTQSG